MIVRKLSEIIGTDRDVDTPNWNSRRLVLADDAMGFSLHDTIIRAGTTTRIWYKHHLEAVYCISGKGTVTTVPDGKVHHIEPDTVYVLDGHEQHDLSAEKDMRLICVFNPPVTGREVHDEDGAYAPPPPVESR